MVLTTNLREIIRVSGNDARGFLQGLVTNDVKKIVVYNMNIMCTFIFLVTNLYFWYGPHLVVGNMNNLNYFSIANSFFLNADIFDAVF